MGIIKKILVIVDSIDINDSSGSKANVALIHNLHEAGFNLKIYHYTQKNIQLKNIECVSVPEKKWNIFYLLSRGQRLFTRITKLNINPFLEGWFGFSFTFFNDSSSIAKAISKLADFKPDLVITLSKGTSFRSHYALLKLPQWHSKWIAYIHDPYPYHFYPRPYNWIQPGYKQKEKFFKNVSEKAKFSAFPSLLLKEWMGSYFPDFLKTGLVIPHQIAKYEIPNSDLPSYFEASKFNMLHAGNLMKQRSPLPLLEAYKNFLKKNPEAKQDSQLLLLGPSSYFNNQIEAYQNELPSLFVKNANVPFAEVLQIQFNADVNIILESKSEISPFLPGKFPHCVAADKPILLLAPYYSETKRVLGENFVNWAEADDILKIENIIEKLYFNWKEKTENTLDRKDLETYLSIDFLKNQIISIIND